MSGSFERSEMRVALANSAAEGEDGGPPSDRWAQAQPLTISPTTKTRNAMRRDKKNQLTKRQLINKSIGERCSLLNRLVQV
jgi:hypothetical protein